MLTALPLLPPWWRVFVIVRYIVIIIIKSGTSPSSSLLLITPSLPLTLSSSSFPRESLNHRRHYRHIISRYNHQMHLLAISDLSCSLAFWRRASCIFDNMYFVFVFLLWHHYLNNRYFVFALYLPSWNLTRTCILYLYNICIYVWLLLPRKI